VEMTRRLLAVALIALAAALGLFGPAGVAHAQQPATPRRIGVLLGGFSHDSKEVQQFRQGLLDAGYVEGRDVVIEWRSAGGGYTRIPALLTELVQHEEVIVVTSTVGAQAAKRTTATIPIVMAVVADPVGSGLVGDLADTPAHDISVPKIQHAN